ncbi:MAG: methytransferase partner Trm112 [Methanomicrobiales archaeon]|nr:methytransferase partner Trm112 [Methanomicrobiales archaeon]
MRRQLLEILACPVCKGGLELKAEEEDEHEVLEGALFCGRCRHEYRITEGIPDLLPPLRRCQ